MKLLHVSLLSSVALLAGCSHSSHQQQPLQPKAQGTQIAEASGSKQMAQVGSALPQPVVVQVNGADGNPVVGALVNFHGEGLRFNPAQVLTDSSGQATAQVDVGFVGGDYSLIAETPKAGGGTATLTLREIALGYQQTLGKAVNDQYCIRCHDSESTAERVSNLDNLSPAPHQFTDGATLNPMTDTDLTNIIEHGGVAVHKSPQMPAYGATLKPAEIRAVVSYMRAVADPPYSAPGVKYAK
ncbi:MAG TPA: c-type cytochrome [Candidatus Dormibacteraeota bacterium]|jgi:mono/diheme cytochrome c family protein|nr:c-type cytochrome [Candidatus Dormibacteraeota bacterium]